MRVSAVVVSVCTLWLGSAGCGEPFTLGGGGAGGGTSTSSGTPKACSPKDGGCGPGEYCATTDCTTGTCAPIPASKGAELDPVCGCDGIAYWNADLAVADGVAFVDLALCDAKTLTTCNPTLPEVAQCDTKNNVYCNLRVYTSCVAAPNGVCTKVPADCKATDAPGRQCFAGTDTCDRICDLVKAEKPWHVPTPACTL
ncbi:Hypothetical protein A7982_04303 [Minicystis rosea]|nr:Hypothetical protein A7982_04303 [Minicystis rosea]